MKNNIASLFVGIIFALGLGISGMTRPEKVIGFLNIFGNWDLSLAYVMAGAIAVHALAYRFIRRRSSPLFTKDFYIPTFKELTPALIVGAFIFGVGWGLAGYCPGPAITSLASFKLRPLMFVASMILGMMAFRVYQTLIHKRRT